MPKYNTNWCERCGMPRIAGTMLCPDCLAADNSRLRWDFEAAGERANWLWEQAVEKSLKKDKEIKELKYQLRLQRKLLRHIFREYQEVQKLKAVDIVA